MAMIEVKSPYSMRTFVVCHYSPTQNLKGILENVKPLKPGSTQPTAPELEPNQSKCYTYLRGGGKIMATKLWEKVA